MNIFVSEVANQYCKFFFINPKFLLHWIMSTNEYYTSDYNTNLCQQNHFMFSTILSQIIAKVGITC